LIVFEVVADFKPPLVPCPHCESTLTEQLPFRDVARPAPVYSCFNCGHVWRQTNGSADANPPPEHKSAK
jgi:uncharacterized Zn finger protein